MSLLGQIIVAGLGAARTRHSPPPQWPMLLAVLAAAVLLALTALAFLALAAFLALSRVASPAAAAAIVAGALFVVALLLVVTILLMQRSKAPAQADAASDPPDLTDLILRVTEFVDARAEKSMPTLALVAAVAGLALGYSPTLRRWLRALIR